MISPSIKAYMRVQEVGPVVGNMICNPLLAWLGNRRMEPMTLFGDRSVVIDTAITSIIASLLVALFAASGVHRDLRAGRLAVPKEMPHAKGVLYRLPQSAWALGLIFGAGIAAVLVTLTLGLFHLFEISGIPFKSFLVIKAIYTAMLGFVVARWAILRELAPARNG